MDLTLRFLSPSPLRLHLRPGRLKLRLGDLSRRLLRGTPHLAAQPGGGDETALKVGRRSALRFPPAHDFGELGIVGLVVFAAAPSVPSHLRQE